MRLHELVDALDLRELTPSVKGEAEITHAYASDLLSDILAHAPAGGILITVQVSPEVITVAALATLRAVIFCTGLTLDDRVIKRAVAEELPVFGSEADSFEVAGQLYELGLRGRHGPRDRSPASLRRPGGRGHPAGSWPEPLSMPLLLEGEDS